MVLAMNMTMAVFATLVLVFSISFFTREKSLGRIRYHILAMGISCSLTSIGYTLMSICKLSKMTLIYRNIGFLGVDLYLYAELVFLIDQIEFKKNKILSRILMVIFAIAVAIVEIVHGRPGEVHFVTVNGFVIFLNNYRLGYVLQSLLATAFFFTLFTLAVYWFRQQNTTRGRSFVILCFIANFMYLFSSFPYFMGIHTEHPAFLYCMGTTLAFMVMWYAGERLSGYAVTEQRLSVDIFGSITTGLLVFDYKGCLTLANDYAKKKMHISGVDNQTLSQIFDISKSEERRVYNEVITSGTAGGKYKIKGYRNSFVVSCILKKDRLNEPLCILCSVIDVTKEDDMIEEVMQANKAKSDFLASMSHEIRTPINAIIGINEMILRESKEDEIRDYAKDVASSGRMLLSLVNDILDFSKIESGKMDIVPVDYDLASLINDVYNMLVGRAVEKGLDFNVYVSDEIPGEMFGDEIRVRQIMMNLLTNAIKYTSKGKVELRVHGKRNINNEKDYKLYFEVRDTGKGIKEEDKKILFESFTRLDESDNRTIEGTGLGLSLTQSFVTMMGGELTCESTYGKGSVFVASIVQQIVSEKPIGDFAKQIEKKNNERELGLNRLYAPGCKVLVVDDVAMNCKVFCGLLKESGIDIHTASSGMEALEFCKYNKYDLIFMDHRMPIMDGVECLHRLREMDTPNKDTQVIVLTANAISGMREMYLEEGFADYITKPIEVEQLENMFRVHVPQLVVKKELQTETDSAPVNNEPVEEKTSITDDLKRIFPELNVDLGLKYCMQDENFYKDMVCEFVRSTRKDVLIEAKNNNDIDNFRTIVHAIKSTSLNIGAEEISAEAKELEMAAKENNIEFIDAHYDAFMDKYLNFLDKIEKNLM